MKKKTILSTILILVVAMPIVLAAYGRVTAISSGSSSYSTVTKKNTITHSAAAKEVLADAVDVKDLDITSISTINGKVEGRTGMITGGKTYRKISHTYSRLAGTYPYATAEAYVKAVYRDGSASYDTDKRNINVFHLIEARSNPVDDNHDKDLAIIANERESIRLKEINMTLSGKEKLSYSNSAGNVDLSRLKHINDVNITNYPEYTEIYFEHIKNNVRVGNYMPSGAYVSEDGSKLYIASLSENKIYEYEVK